MKTSKAVAELAEQLFPESDEARFKDGVAVPVENVKTRVVFNLGQ